MSEEKVQRLSEGMDFIEEECGLSEGLTFEEVNETIISESEKHKSPFKIIGTVKGVIQPIGELSRNRRLYPATFWPEILSTPEIQERLASRDMLGCISHADKKVDCADLKSGEVSHIVTKLEVREDAEGTPFLYGEMEILDTPAGRIIKALYEGGANIYVSTRGAGKLVDVPGKPYREVLSSSYWLETVDFVRRPGFVKAHPAFEAVEEPTTQSHPIVAESKVAEVQSAPEISLITESTSELQSQIDKLAKIVEKVVEGMDSNKVFDLDHKINNVEKIRKEEREKLLNSKDHLEAHKSEARIAQADNLLKRLNKSRKEALGESQASLIGALALLQEANLSEEAMEEIVDEIKKGLK